MTEAPHDLGGKPGFGPVPAEEGDVIPFRKDWEAHIYGIYRVLAKKGLLNEHEMRHAVESLDRDEYLSSGYYERWVYAIERVMIDKGLLVDGS